MKAASRLLPLLAAATISAQELPVFRAETSLALVRFHVVKKNAYVDNLRPQDILLLEDGIERPVALLEGGGTRLRTVPIELVLLFDVSGSVTHQGLLDAVAFEESLLRSYAGLRLSVYAFHARLFKFSGPTRDTEQLARAFARVASFPSADGPKPEPIELEPPGKRKSNRGGSWIYESVAAAARDATKGPGNPTRMLLVVSDGFSTTGAGPSEVTPLLRELGIAVYPLVLGHARIAERARQLQQGAVNRQGVMKEGARRQMDRLQDQEHELDDFASLGESTGGRSFDPAEMNPQVLRQVLAALAGLVQYEYVAGFMLPSSGEAPRKHKVEVKLRQKDLGKVLGGVRTVVH